MPVALNELHLHINDNNSILKGFVPDCISGDQCFKTSGLGPHPTSCLGIWWLNGGCTMLGSLAPYLSQAVWNNWDVAQVQSEMGLYYQLAIDGEPGYFAACIGIDLG